METPDSDKEDDLGHVDRGEALDSLGALRLHLDPPCRPTSAPPGLGAHLLWSADDLQDGYGLLLSGGSRVEGSFRGPDRPRSAPVVDEAPDYDGASSTTGSGAGFSFRRDDKGLGLFSFQGPDAVSSHGGYPPPPSTPPMRSISRGSPNLGGDDRGSYGLGMKAGPLGSVAEDHHRGTPPPPTLRPVPEVGLAPHRLAALTQSPGGCHSPTPPGFGSPGLPGAGVSGAGSRSAGPHPSTSSGGFGDGDGPALLHPGAVRAFQPFDRPISAPPASMMDNVLAFQAALQTPDIRCDDRYNEFFELHKDNNVNLPKPLDPVKDIARLRFDNQPASEGVSPLIPKQEWDRAEVGGASSTGVERTGSAFAAATGFGELNSGCGGLHAGHIPRSPSPLWDSQHPALSVSAAHTAAVAAQHAALTQAQMRQQQQHHQEGGGPPPQGPPSHPTQGPTDAQAHVAATAAAAAAAAAQQAFAASLASAAAASGTVPGAHPHQSMMAGMALPGAIPPMQYAAAAAALRHSPLLGAVGYPTGGFPEAAMPPPYGWQAGACPPPMPLHRDLQGVGGPGDETLLRTGPGGPMPGQSGGSVSSCLPSANSHGHPGHPGQLGGPPAVGREGGKGGPPLGGPEWPPDAHNNHSSNSNHNNSSNNNHNSGRDNAGGTSSSERKPQRGGYKISALEELFNSDAYIRNVYSIAKDQAGCRMLQHKLDENNSEVTNTIFNEVLNHIVELMMDPFGNYLCQKLMDICSNHQLQMILDAVCNDLVDISLNMHGARAVQKLIDVIRTTPHIPRLVAALEGSIVPLTQDANGNHVVQRCLEALPPETRSFIFRAVATDAVEVATHRHGCRIVQRCIDAAAGHDRQQLVSAICVHTLTLVQDAFGNYVIQYVLGLNDAQANSDVVRALLGRLGVLSRQKYSSNVVERCLQLANDEDRLLMIRELSDSRVLGELLRDVYGNYVVQSALTVTPAPELARVLGCVRPLLPSLRANGQGRRIAQKLEKKYPQLRNGGSNTGPTGGSGSGSRGGAAEATPGNSSTASQGLGFGGPGSQDMQQAIGSPSRGGGMQSGYPPHEGGGDQGRSGAGNKRRGPAPPDRGSSSAGPNNSNNTNNNTNNNRRRDGGDTPISGAR